MWTGGISHTHALFFSISLPPSLSARVHLTSATVILYMWTVQSLYIWTGHSLFKVTFYILTNYFCSLVQSDFVCTWTEYSCLNDLKHVNLGLTVHSDYVRVNCVLLGQSDCTHELNAPRTQWHCTYKKWTLPDHNDFIHLIWNLFPDFVGMNWALVSSTDCSVCADRHFPSLHRSSLSDLCLRRTPAHLADSPLHRTSNARERRDLAHVQTFAFTSVLSFTHVKSNAIQSFRSSGP